LAVDRDISRTALEHELDRAGSSAERRGWQLQWNADTLLLQASITAPDGEAYVFEFQYDDYPELPPKIDAIYPGSNERNTPRCFPSGGRGYFHPTNLICAPWSRNAYKRLGGPHGDWAIGDWRQADPLRKELGPILTLLADLLEDSTYQGRRAQ